MQKKIQASCYQCRNETNHEVLYSCNGQYDTLDENGDVEITEYEEYCTIKCLGCENLSFLLISKIDGEPGKEEAYRAIYPHEYNPLFDDEFDNEYGFLSEKEVNTLPPLVKKIYKEVEEAFSFDLPILSGIGLRTLLESICIERKIPGKNLKDKIDNLHKVGLIANDLPILHSLREIGNITVHQIKKPTQKTLDYSLEILMHILKSLYIIPKLHSKLKK
jgi:hypothetical protein